MSQREEIGAFLAAIRNVEGGSYDGNYFKRTPDAVGAYQFMRRQWDQMASMAGMPNASIMDNQSQDLVAGYWANRWHQRYGDWGLVAAAWIGGQDSADRIALRGFENTSAINNEKIAQYVDQVLASRQDALESGQTRTPEGIERMLVEYTGPQGQWLHPIAGKAEYSNSFRTPRDSKTGIHGAIDVYAKKGTPIVSPVSGKVLSVRTGGKGGYTVTIMGNDGHKYYFAHMESEARVERGETINAGTHVGYVGNSGNAAGTSPHLHLSMRDSQNRIVNPFNYLKGSGAGGGAFQAVDPETVTIDTKRDFGDMTRAAMEATGRRIAGGERVDPRTLGFVEDEPEPEESEIDDKQNLYQRMRGGPR